MIFIWCYAPLNFNKMDWIKIKDRKPKYGKRVLVYAKGENVVISRLETDGEYGETWHDDDLNTFTSDTVEFWMELPLEPNGA